MKKSIFVFITVLSAALVFSQSITVTSPRGGENWEKGIAHNITWTSSGCTDTNVKINIFRNSIDTANFVEQITGPNSGTARWTIPAAYTTGRYILRVKTNDNICVGDSGVFNIVPLTLREVPPVPSTGAELSIEGVSREDDKFVRLGEVLNFRIYVKNSGSDPANICVATPNSDKNENFYSKGQCMILEGMSTKFCRISIPITRGLMKAGRFTTTVFLIKGGTTGLLGSVLWKDSNSRDNFKTISYPQSIPVMAAVTGVTLSGTPLNYSGPCPKTIRFTGQITCTDPGEVRYKWIRSDLPNTNNRPQWGTIPRNGTLTVTFDWNIGQTGRAAAFRDHWVALEILPPEYFNLTPIITSNRVVFTLICEGD